MHSPSSAKSSRKRHLAYTETRYTDDFGTEPEDKTQHGQLPLTRAVRGADLRADRHRPGRRDDLDSRSRDNLYFTLDELRSFRLSPVHQTSGTTVTEIRLSPATDRDYPGETPGRTRADAVLQG